VPNAVKVAVTRFDRAAADRVFAALRELAVDPFAGEVHPLDTPDSYLRVVAGCLVFFEVDVRERTVDVTAVERPH
jgi:hypothetical protein